MLVDYFIEKLTCPYCNAVSDGDTSEGMQTKLQASPGGFYLKIGDIVQARIDGPEQIDYVLLKAPESSENYSLLHSWKCASCGELYNWAEIIIRDNVIEKIQAVKLNGDLLRRVNYIYNDIEIQFMIATDKDFYCADRSVNPEFWEWVDSL